MPILEGFNPFSWQERVNDILAKSPVVYGLEPVTYNIGVIQLFTDMNKNVHIYTNGKRAYIGGFHFGEVIQLRTALEDLDRKLHKKYKYVKIEAFLPFWFLKRLYLPDYWKPYKKSRKKRII